MSDNNNPQVQSHYPASNGGVTRDNSWAAGVSQSNSGSQPAPQQHNESQADYNNRVQGHNWANGK